MDWLQPNCSERSGAKCSIPHELNTDLDKNLHSCIYDLVKVAFRDGRGSGDWRVSEHADFYFQQRSIWFQRIISATKRDDGSILISLLLIASLPTASCTRTSRW
jgi:hypothetical protein